MAVWHRLGKGGGKIRGWRENKKVERMPRRERWREDCKVEGKMGILIAYYMGRWEEECKMRGKKI